MQCRFGECRLFIQHGFCRSRLPRNIREGLSSSCQCFLSRAELVRFVEPARCSREVLSENRCVRSFKQHIGQPLEPAGDFFIFRVIGPKREQMELGAVVFRHSEVARFHSFIRERETVVDRKLTAALDQPGAGNRQIGRPRRQEASSQIELRARSRQIVGLERQICGGNQRLAVVRECGIDEAHRRMVGAKIPGKAARSQRVFGIVLAQRRLRLLQQHARNGVEAGHGLRVLRLDLQHAKIMIERIVLRWRDITAFSQCRARSSERTLNVARGLRAGRSSRGRRCRTVNPIAPTC
ncbi:MAG: hypothetical protein H0W33_05470 [Gammaproteobacteria bacterium]|nr:hypothetical protein [Gammaproteobacteria bacterium]